MQYNKIQTIPVQLPLSVSNHCLVLIRLASFYFTVNSQFFKF